MPIKIDVVFTYVDGNDPKWVEKKNKYFTDELKPINSILRFVSINEIYYSVKTVLHFAPWVNKIYIVTDEQTPPLKELYDSNKIVIIDHKDIIPSEYLPTFFSDVIESYIHNIPKLSEIFIYNNDDFFFFDNILISDIIQNKKLKIINTHNPNQADNCEYHIRITNTIKLLNFDSYVNNHCSKFLRKTTLKYIEKEYKPLLDELRKYKFRNTTSIQYLFLALNVDHKLHNNIIIPRDNNNFIGHSFSTGYNETLKPHFVYKKCKFTCFNNMNHTFKPVFKRLMNKVFK